MTSVEPTPGPAGSSAPLSAAAAPATSGSAAPGKLAPTAITGLQLALRAENAAIWSYALVAAFDADDRDTIATMRDAHLVRRDDASTRLLAAGQTPGPAAPSYQIPKPVTDKESAMALALVIEGDCAAAWLGVVSSTDNADLRSYALAGLTDAALRTVRWKQLAKITPVTTAFPGR